MQPQLGKRKEGRQSRATVALGMVNAWQHAEHGYAKYVAEEVTRTVLKHHFEVDEDMRIGTVRKDCNAARLTKRCENGMLSVLFT